MRVALIHADRPRQGAERIVGWWSYDVPEFAVADVPVADKFAALDRANWERCTWLVQEDYGIYPDFSKGGPPLAYQVVDSVLSEAHYSARVTHAMKHAQLVLLDCDDAKRWQKHKLKTAQLPYCVNERLFQRQSGARPVDIGYYCRTRGPGGAERARVGQFLRRLCQKHNWVLDWSNRVGEDYARGFGEAKVAINVGRNPLVRSHRLFDAMACGAAVLATPMPDVDGEERADGTHYWTWPGGAEWDGQLELCLQDLLQQGAWETVGNAGAELVARAHTWSTRAAQLRAILEAAL